MLRRRDSAASEEERGLVLSGTPVTAIRIELKSLTFSFQVGAYRWCRLEQTGPGELLTIRVLDELFLVRGNRLDRIRDALEEQRLRCLKVTPEGIAAAEGELRIDSIETGKEGVAR